MENPGAVWGFGFKECKEVEILRIQIMGKPVPNLPRLFLAVEITIPDEVHDASNWRWIVCDPVEEILSNQNVINEG